MQPDMDPIELAKIEWDGVTPAAPAFEDTYFSIAGGPEESQRVFLDGCDLAGRFDRLRAGDAFVIGETGFGTGLNLLLAAALFRRHAAPGARLHLVSAEKHPLPRADLARALAAWPELADWAQPLVDQYPPAVCGFHRLWLTSEVDLTLMFGDATAMWAAQDAAVDAWFLDGFAPSRNPSMWSAALFARIARLSRPGAALATFSAAGAVRRGLADAGFAVERRPGFGRKRHRLEARFPGRWTPRTVARGHALVIGAGLAGCTTANALSARGWTCRLIDGAGIAEGASGNRSGVVYTTPSGMATPQNRFYQSSWLHALRRFRLAGAEARGIARFGGVEQVLTDDRQRRKILGALTSGHWPSDLLQRLDEDRVLLTGGGVVRPPAWCRALVDRAGIEVQSGTRVERLEGECAVRLSNGTVLEADAVVLCTSGATADLLERPGLPIRTIRGQVTEVAARPTSLAWTRAVCHTGYLAPALDGVHCIGATFDLHTSTAAVRDEDDRANLDALRRWCPGQWAALGGESCEVRGARVGFRCTSRDYLPLVGPWRQRSQDAPAGTWLNIAFGSRGLSSTPLAAESIADRLTGAPAPIDRAIREALAPSRFD
ncbi:bifunctional tRNA (5-methylaminomethyl-2-thiouridine)(34)-methyltransferase MnmC2/FAD-dependent 5-carboxymethylaminomethyl-2-thiouridine(34) oxidoreductase MnmC1 [Halomonas denitrificans]|nr:bifunctional tRNA (5-methylaminomethyl-2-thiouridine)(34)-methyltransferase MnmD/FAD-dependent 5-carboxymethylaminomethyl-2-thiouridine(34) oxidoreductase MnmC [Halomonas denitrificans]